MGDSIHDDSDMGLPSSRQRKPKLPDPGVLQVYQTGPVTVVGFGGEDVPDEVCIAAYREQLVELIKQERCSTLAFDLTGVRLIPSGMLGVLVTLRKLVDRVELFNPSEDVRDVLRLTNLECLFEFKEVPV